MNTKYEFVAGDTKVIAPGRTLKRIRALTAIAALGVMPGSLGGYIESETCLSVSGNAWVYGDAWVYGNAQVYGGAQVSGNARVYGDAQVYGNAQVYGGAQVSGNARVYGDAQVSGNAWVYGNAQVYGNALVYGNARVYGNAQVYGGAQVSGNARVYGDARVSDRRAICWFTGVGTDHATLTACYDKDGNVLLTRGCFCGSVDEFIARSQAQHDEDTQHEYRLLIEVAISRLARSRKSA